MYLGRLESGDLMGELGGAQEGRQARQVRDREGLAHLLLQSTRLRVSGN